MAQLPQSLFSLLLGYTIWILRTRLIIGFERFTRKSALAVDLDRADKNKTSYSRLHSLACQPKGALYVDFAKLYQGVHGSLMHHMHSGGRVNDYLYAIQRGKSFGIGQIKRHNGAHTMQPCGTASSRDRGELFVQQQPQDQRLADKSTRPCDQYLRSIHSALFPVNAVAQQIKKKNTLSRTRRRHCHALKDSRSSCQRRNCSQVFTNGSTPCPTRRAISCT
ncbi:hypothetical protein D9M71_474660 [compost metagenome]